MSKFKGANEEGTVASLGKIPDGPLSKKRYVNKLKRQKLLKIDRKFNSIVPESTKVNANTIISFLKESS